MHESHVNEPCNFVRCGVTLRKGGTELGMQVFGRQAFRSELRTQRPLQLNVHA